MRFGWLVLLALGAGCTDDGFNPDGGAALGGAFVAARGCATCHQSSEPKWGTLSGQDDPRPGTMSWGSNLTPDRETGIGGWADIQIARALRTGVDDQGLPLCSPMPIFSDMTDLEAYAIVDFLRSLPPVRHPIAGSVCAADMAGVDLAAVDLSIVIDLGTND